MGEQLNEYGEEIPNPIPSTSKLSVLVDRDLYKKFKLKTVQNGETITGVINEMIKEYVSK